MPSQSSHSGFYRDIVTYLDIIFYKYMAVNVTITANSGPFQNNAILPDRCSSAYVFSVDIGTWVDHTGILFNSRYSM